MWNKKTQTQNGSTKAAKRKNMLLLDTNFGKMLLAFVPASDCIFKSPSRLINRIESDCVQFNPRFAGED